LDVAQHAIKIAARLQVRRLEQAAQTQATAPRQVHAQQHVIEGRIAVTRGAEMEVQQRRYQSARSHGS
jgi:hypothetical protein